MWTWGRPAQRKRAIHGTLVVEPAAAQATAPPPAAADETDDAEVAAARQAGSEAAEDVEAAERRTEIRDLTRRFMLAAVLTAPVLFAVMAHEVFRAGWVPGWLLKHCWQLVLITPVMFYAGSPIHRTGWLALAHRAPDMNSLITLGTSAAHGYSLLATVAPNLLPAGVWQVYFEAVGVILILILLGRLIETRAKAGTGATIRALIGLAPRTATVVRRR